MSNGIDVGELSRQSAFIFKGTVKERGATNVSNVPVNNRTLIVTVNEILKTPDLMAHLAGEDITVQLGDGQRGRVGQERIFYTNGWIYGESVAVISLGHTAAGVRASATADAAVATEPVAALQARVDRAEMVVAGKVVDIQEPDDTGTTRISEHDPVWREAVVEVDDVAKGALADDQNQVVVRFAASDDISWYQAPKFDVGQEGVWMLGDTSATAARVALGEEEGRYLALDETDFVSKDELDNIRSMIEGGNS